MANRTASNPLVTAQAWFLGVAIIAVIAVTLEGEVSGGALGGIVTVAMLASAFVALTVRPFAPLPRPRRITCRLLYTAGLFGAWLAIGITAWDWDGPNLIVALAFCGLALLRAAFPPASPEAT